MTAVLLVLVIALLDGAFSGFRSAQGRSGLVDHRHEDRAGMRLGLWLLAILATPAVAMAWADVAVLGQPLPSYDEAARGFLLVAGPYAVVVLVALTAYGVLGWEKKYLASALILGPGTLLRPYVALAAVGVAVVRVPDASVGAVVLLALLGALAVEPLASLLMLRSARTSLQGYALEGATSDPNLDPAPLRADGPGSTMDTSSEPPRLPRAARGQISQNETGDP